MSILLVLTVLFIEALKNAERLFADVMFHSFGIAAGGIRTDADV